jgi:peptidoglycan hydrolase-like protein with peptidoglycan-binding domain
MGTVAALLNEARKHIGSKERSIFISWFGGHPNDTPWCDIFVSYCAAASGNGSIIGKEAACRYHADKFRNKGQLLPGNTTPRAGDIIFFDFIGGKPYPQNQDHVGIVESVSGTKITTIEGNAGGGYFDGSVQRRTRQVGMILNGISAISAYGRPAYSGTGGVPAPAPAPSPSAVDGVFGPATVKRWQQIMGTTADGIISGQYSGNKKYHQQTGTIQYGSGGSNLVRAVQRKFGITQDGHLGPVTIMTIQRHLGVTADGYFSANPSSTVRALQTRLNTGNF